MVTKSLRRVVVAGGHGQVARLLLAALAQRGHRAVGLIRNPDHAGDLEMVGADAVVFDLEQQTAAALAEIARGADALVFAAGSEPDSGPALKMTVDRDGAVLVADAAELAGVRRLVVISSMAADEHFVGSDDVFQIYLRAKAEADELIRERDLDWTIVRPGGLTDEPPTGAVRVAERTDRGTIPRADVAALVLQLVEQPLAVRRQFEVISGDTPIDQALRGLGSGD